jgi:hypothetical protein
MSNSGRPLGLPEFARAQSSIAGRWAAVEKRQHRFEESRRISVKRQLRRGEIDDRRSIGG